MTTKSGALKVDMHDKLNAMNSLAKVLGLWQEPTPQAPSVTVTQLNVGDVAAVEVARRLAYLLASVDGAKTIDVVPAKAKPQGAGARKPDPKAV